jgi:dTDP-4-amino-4,6-dideoxygalactose transaminase
MNFSPWPCFTEEEAQAVRDVLLSNNVNYWTGDHGRQFEKEFASFSDAEYAVAVANGTLALDLAMVALGIGHHGKPKDGEMDEVIVTSRTFIASVSSIVNAGAKPVFADVDPDTQNITASSIQAVVTNKTRAVVCVHLAGMPCEMDEIMRLAAANDLRVIEDCAQAHGARYRGQSVGSIGHVGAWSFCQDKIMTTGGEGGMVTTNDEQLWKKMWAYKDHGKSYDAVFHRDHRPGFRWLHESMGSNFRMTEMQAVIGRIQIKRMPGWKAKRHANAKRLARVCKQFDSLRLSTVPDYVEHANYKFYVFVRQDHLPPDWSRDRIISEIEDAGVPCFQGSCSEVYLEKAFGRAGLRPTQVLKEARFLGDTSLMFLVHPTLTEQEIVLTENTIREVFNRIAVDNRSRLD